MNDIADRLRQFQPARPPSELRGRVVDAARRPQTARGSRWLEWLPAAAAAAAAILFYTLSLASQASLNARFSVADQPRAALISDLATSLGGDDLARRQAEWLVEIDERGTR
jgi:hypothetical protein